MNCPKCGINVDPNDGLDLEYRPNFNPDGSHVEVEICCPNDHTFYAVYKFDAFEPDDD